MSKKDLIQQRVSEVIAQEPKFPDLLKGIRNAHCLTRSIVARDTGINYNELVRIEYGLNTSQIPDSVLNRLTAYYDLHGTDFTLLHRKHQEFLDEQAACIKCPNCQFRFSPHHPQSKMARKRNTVQLEQITNRGLYGSMDEPKSA